MNDVRPVMEGVFEQGPPPRLLGGCCPDCGKKYFPKPGVCPHCLVPLQDAELSSAGLLHSFTVVRVKPPFGLPQPYGVGFVDLEADGLRIFSLLDSEKLDQLAIGQQVALRIAPYGVDVQGQTCLRYYFTPEDGDRHAAS